MKGQTSVLIRAGFSAIAWIAGGADPGGSASQATASGAGGFVAELNSIARC